MDDASPYQIRPLTLSDEKYLWKCLALAIYVPPGTPPPDPEILKKPELSKYVAGWGKPTDEGWAAFDAKTFQNLGALWLRYFTAQDPGYGFVEELIPELSMAVVPEARGRGIGSSLLKNLLTQKKYPALSLSVAPGNPALRLYQRFGFKKIGEKGDSWIMLWKKDQD